jgi:hypothetical protein
MARWLRLPVFAILCVGLLTACGSEERRSDAGRSTTTSPGAGLPRAVADKREAIAAAAQALDYDRLRRLLDPSEFSYSFGESGDPIGYWRRLERDAHMPVIGDYLPLILNGPFATRGDIYVWPSVYGKKPSAWTAAERRSLRNFYSEEDIRSFERAGDYLGWRVGIRKDGTWLFYVAGD